MSDAPLPLSWQAEVALRDQELAAAQAVGKPARHVEDFKPKQELSSTLLKKSPTFPYPWQKRDVRLVGGHSIMYKSGSGGEKGISMHEVRTVRMTDPAACEFEILTATDKNFKFRASDRHARDDGNLSREAPNTREML